MAINERGWQEITHEQLLEFVRWGQNNLNLRDWDITLDTNNDVPKSLKELEREHGYTIHGGTRVWDNYLKALIWIPLDRVRIQDANPLECICHEMIHIITIGLMELEDRDSEVMTYRFEDLLYRLYCLENDISISEVKP